MKGHVARKGNRYYAVIDEGLDPITGKPVRKWHCAGTQRSDAEALAARLVAEIDGRDDDTRGLTFGAYLTTQWPPGKRISLAPSTYAGYRRNTEIHVLPTLGKVKLRGLRHHHLERLYESKLHPTDGQRALAPKAVYEIHLVIRGALTDAVRRGMVNTNIALVTNAPKMRSIPKVEQQAWTADQLATFLRTAAGHRYFAALWTSANTGMRRSELLGLRWEDLDTDNNTVSINRGLLSIGYELHESRGKTDNSRRCIDLDPTTMDVLAAWRAWQHAEQHAVGVPGDGRMFTDADHGPIHPHSISQAFERISRRAEVPVIRLHDLRHTHGTLLIKAGIPVKVVSERLGHANPVFTIDTYQHVLPGMQAEAARVFAGLLEPGLLQPTASNGSAR